MLGLYSIFTAAAVVPIVLVSALVVGEMLQNGGFESLEGWQCYGCTLTLSASAKRSGQYGMAVTGRSQRWHGPSQFLDVSCGQPSYQASGYVKLLTDQEPQTVNMVVQFKLTDGTYRYAQVDAHHNVQLSDGWVHLIGSFFLPTAPLNHARVYFSGPDDGVDFAVDDASVTCQRDVPLTSDEVIEQIRKSDINIKLKVRGHTLVWSLPSHVQSWVKQLQGQELKDVVSQHIQETMDKTFGLLEHWDVNNENLHGQWYQDQLQDPDYHLELFRIAHHYDPSVKLFLNDYNVVAGGYSTQAYLDQAQEVSRADVGLYGLGAQCHFGPEVRPDPVLMKENLDTLARSGLPIWATELDVMAQDEQTRAEFYETALRALYGHPAVEGILFWGFWDQQHWRGERAALFKGYNLEPTAAGERVVDLLENQWMTRETRDLAESGGSFTVRGFHGDYEVRVYNGGAEMENLRSTFTLDKKNDHPLTLHIQ